MGALQLMAILPAGSRRGHVTQRSLAARPKGNIYADGAGRKPGRERHHPHLLSALISF
jgi:hypothetical protein